ncbi:hypothetical protein X474_11240 [Dethiosulfatarculus sandiegensis]|uniref:Uncharacterized protein n=1 Tax=Dethiosulfatarculus sandiegensis TaxID=1429043 RepID=A0A0D2J6P8_9BACT|nr:hypothetical protein X474_11240 [Dethiosulfatarculus sandiegensis]
MFSLAEPENPFQVQGEILKKPFIIKPVSSL